MSNAHEQIDTLITTNTLKDFLTSAMQDETFTAGTVGRTPNILERINRGKSIEALKHSPARRANLSNLNMKRLPGGIEMGRNVRPQFGGPLVAAMTLAPALQELLYSSMGLDPSGLEDEAPWFPEGSPYNK